MRNLIASTVLSIASLLTLSSSALASPIPNDLEYIQRAKQIVNNQAFPSVMLQRYPSLFIYSTSVFCQARARGYSADEAYKLLFQDLVDEAETKAQAYNYIEYGSLVQVMHTQKCPQYKEVK